MAAHRQAFPTPRGATGGCPPDTVCGGRPRGPRGATGGCPPGSVMRGIVKTFRRPRRAAYATGTAAYQGFRTASPTLCDAPYRRSARS